jgi:hypothetical protein
MSQLLLVNVFVANFEGFNHVPCFFNVAARGR